MKNNVFILLKNQLLNFLGINKILHKNKENPIKILFLALGIIALVAIIGFVAFIYLDLFADSLNQSGMIVAFIPLLFICATVLILFSSIISTNGTLYAFKDYEMVMSLPVKKTEVVLSKIIYIYVSNLLFSLLIYVLGLFVLSKYMVVSSLYVVKVLGLALFTPFIPMALAVFLGILLAFITSRFKRKNAIQLIFYTVLFLVVFLMPSVSEDSIVLSSKFIEVLGNIAKAFDNILIYVAYLFCSLAIIALIYLFLSKNFTKINTILLSQKTKSKFKYKEVKQKGVVTALLQREIKRFFSCVTYALNCLVMPIIMLVAVIFLGIVFSDIMKALGVTDKAAFQQILLIFLALMALMGGIAPTTSCSISIEGKTLWVLKSLPASESQIFTAKIILNNVFFLPIMLISSLILLIVAQTSIVFSILFVLASVLIPFTFSLIGLVVNLFMPFFDWETESVAVKRGLSVFVTMVINIFIIALCCVAVYFISEFNVVLSLIIAILILVLFTVISILLLSTKGKKLFGKL